MKEKLKEYLRVEWADEMHYGASVDSWMEMVDHFFECCPERSKREDMNYEKLNVVMDSDSSYPHDDRLYS